MKNKIKITMIAIFMLLIVSCSSSIEEPITSDGINPPDWILGTWSEIISKGSFGFTNVGTVIFEEDDITIGYFDGDNDYSLQSEFLNSSYVPSVSSTSTSDEFSVKFNYSNEYYLFTFTLDDGNLDWKYTNVRTDLNLLKNSFDNAITFQKISE
jgi:hypothetical protein